MRYTKKVNDHYIAVVPAPTYEEQVDLCVDRLGVIEDILIPFLKQFYDDELREFACSVELNNKYACSKEQAEIIRELMGVK